MPWPAHVTRGAGGLAIDASFTAGVTGAGAADPRVQRATLRALDRLFDQTGIPARRQLTSLERKPTLLVIVERGDAGIQKLGDDESYRLTVTPQQVKIAAPAPLGALRGLETFLQMVHLGPSGFVVPVAEITDQPRFGWRGLTLDLSRHYIRVDAIKRIVDGLAAVKMNVLHLHITDDQGFRIECKKYPLLHEKGSDNLYYTQAEVRDLIAYARDRGVRIVPEFEMPAHATSWFPGHPELASGTPPYGLVRIWGGRAGVMDPTKETTYEFLDGIIGEMARLFPDDYFHIGGDEVNFDLEWAKNPRIEAFMRENGIKTFEALQAHFNRRLLKIITKYGKRMVGWDEILQPDLPKSIVIQSWRGQKSLADAARQGFSGILSSGYYLDLMQPASEHYSVDPMKDAAANLTPDERKRILGGEAAMWEEIASTENIDSRIWPRLAAIAERLWSPEEVTDVESMYRRLGATSRWLEFQGMKHRRELRLMQMRLAGSHDVIPLAIFAAVLEPIKGYSRHESRPYGIDTPLNRLVDAVAPESDESRKLREAVDRFLRSPSSNTADAAYIRGRLATWQRNVSEVMPILENNALLTENIPVARAVGDLCAIGLEALEMVESRKRADPNWVSRQLKAVESHAAPKAEMLIQFAPGIRKLVEALAR